MPGDDLKHHVKAEVTFIYKSGWARAKILEGVGDASNGEFVAITPKHALSNGDKVRKRIF
eukprot:14219786-Ditylum_brightwellii.AAC.1